MCVSKSKFSSRETDLILKLSFFYPFALTLTSITNFVTPLHFHLPLKSTYVTSKKPNPQICFRWKTVTVTFYGKENHLVLYMLDVLIQLERRHFISLEFNVTSENLIF